MDFPYPLNTKTEYLCVVQLVVTVLLVKILQKI